MDNELIEKIHDVMVEHMGGKMINHYVAQDFSMAELENFIHTYFNYLMK